MVQLEERDVAPEQVAKIPRIVDVDAHLVEPPGIWADRLPAKYRDVGPRVEYHPGGEIILDGAVYKEAPGTEGPDVAWWHYEDTFTSLKRTIAASGFKPEEITLTGTTFDEIRPGCFSVPERLADMDTNHVEAQLCFPNYPRFAGQIFLWGKDRELADLCIRAYNDWMVEEWCGTSGGRLLPLCIVPLWDADAAAAEVRRNAARGVRAVAFTEMPSVPRACRASTRATGTRSSVPATRPTPSICLHIGSGTKTLQTSPDASAAVPATLIFANSAASMVDFLFSGVLAPVSRTSSCSTPRRRSGGSRTCSSAPTTCGSRTSGPAARWRARSRRRPTTSARSTAASSRTRSA